VFPLEGYTNAKLEKNKRAFCKGSIFSPSINLNYQDNLKAFARVIASYKPAYILVIGSGQQKESLEKIFADIKQFTFIYCDIDSNAEVDLFCDAHELPFVERVFHGVIITAVLEHVLYPERVVNEIHRVLVDGGAIYSEIPFMQQVHEGAYDFTRYTLSGHRLLMNQFQELSSGLVAGPGTALVWAIENFALCFAWNNASRLFIKASVRLQFFWLKYFDYLFKRNLQAIDSASCTYFLGQKNSSTKTSDKKIIEKYTGAKHFYHV
jgi:SAM-dependent methyltransferase